jgi:catechol 2,3-dioxygenase-like lactoylglutathione lyase family enzyme
MVVRALHHFNIRSSRSEVMRLRDFYCDVIGLSEGSRPPFLSPGFWLYADDHPVLHLMIAPESEALPALANRRSAAGHIAFRCSDFDGSVERLRRHDIPHRITKVPSTQEMQIFLHDPSGVGVELIFCDS